MQHDTTLPQTEPYSSMHLTPFLGTILRHDKESIWTALFLELSDILNLK